ncbi:MAG TPA: chloride channel protein [Devosiaceae bacterium]
MTDTIAKAATTFPFSIAGFNRYRGLFLLGLAGGVGIVAGLVVTAISGITYQLHILMFDLPENSRLSAQAVLASPWMALLPLAGGILMGLSIVLARRWRTRSPVDPIEANAVHGGRMSFRESLIVTVQTIISSSFGASVGLEAAYTQMSSALASHFAGRLALRRNEVRMLVGCGAAGGIAAAFNAPLTGAFYGFELIIGVYSAALLPPVMVASLAATLTASHLGAIQSSVEAGDLSLISSADVLPCLALGLIGGGVAIGIMQLVAHFERVLSIAKCPPPIRPALGGIVVGLLALITPEILSSGHGALHVQFNASTAPAMLLLLFALKAIASIVSLGTGFRGGLFFASLFLGALLGKLFSAAMVFTGLAPHLAPELAALVGMASLAVGVVGGPLTMTFLVLETTGDLAISVAVLFASVMSSFLVRETFGYSFSTWRLHLRGESIRSAHDIGRMRSLIVAAMMRPDVRTAPITMTLAKFCDRFPLGSTERVIATDDDGIYQGIVLVAEAHQVFRAGGDVAEGNIEPLLKYTDRVLTPRMTAKDAALQFEASNSEELAVVDNADRRKVVGLLTEAYLLRRYAEELDKGWKDLTGESA